MGGLGKEFGEDGERKKWDLHVWWGWRGGSLGSELYEPKDRVEAQRDGER